MRYDFELSQVEPAAPARAASSIRDGAVDRRGPREDPTSDGGCHSRNYLQVAIRPRAGWYPATLLASEIGLLVFLAWLLPSALTI